MLKMTDLLTGLQDKPLMEIALKSLCALVEVPFGS